MVEFQKEISPNLFESQSDISFKKSKNKDHSSSDDNSVRGKEISCNSRKIRIMLVQMATV